MIKVFVASSNELKDERDELAVAVLGLNGWLYSRGEEERVALEKWEYLDSSMEADPKQETYNRALRGCDLAVGLCWRKFGQYTEGEVAVAREEIAAGRRVRRLEIWFKEDAGKEGMTPELASFRERLEREGSVEVRRFGSMAALRGLFTEMVLKELENRGIEPPDDTERKSCRLVPAENTRMNQMESRKYTYNHSTVTLLFGDVLRTKADVIVSSDDSDMSMGGGVSRHIAEAAGENIWKTIAKYPPVPLGDVVVTDAGELPQKYIFHCITIDYHDLEWEGKFGSREEYHNFIIQHAVDKCFRLMQSMNLSSIAFPLIGTGSARIPLTSAASQMAECFAKNLQKTNKCLNIELYLFDRFGQLSDLDYLPVFEQFAIMSAWGRFMKGESAAGEDEDTPVSPTIAPCKQDVFISYSRNDAKQALEIRNILEEKHVSYWIDEEGMYSQESFKAVLVDAIKASRVVVFLSSKDSNASAFVQKEISMAVKYRKTIIPILLDDAPFAPSIEFDLQDIDHLDYHGDFQQKLLMNIQLCRSKTPAKAAKA